MDAEHRMWTDVGDIKHHNGDVQTVLWLGLSAHWILTTLWYTYVSIPVFTNEEVDAERLSNSWKAEGEVSDGTQAAQKQNLSSATITATSPGP